MDVNNTLNAVWAVDSETGEEMLIDRKSGSVIARKDRNGNIVDPGATKC